MVPNGIGGGPIIQSGPATQPQPSTNEAFNIIWRLRIFATDQSFMGGGTPDPTENLVSFTNIKSKSQTNPVGQATFTLTAQSAGGYQWKNLPLMSVVVFQIRPTAGSLGGYDFRTRFEGYVINVQEKWQTTQTGAQRFVVLTCVDNMQAFQSQVYFPTSLAVTSPNTPVSQQAEVQGLLTKLMSVQQLSTSTQNTTFSYLGSLLAEFAETTNKSAALFLAPSSALWALVRWILPIFFNPTTQAQFQGGSGLASWQDWLSCFFVPSASFQYGFVYPMTQTTWWNNMTPWLNSPFFECFGDIRSQDELSDLLIQDPQVQLPINVTGVTSGAQYNNDITLNGTIAVNGTGPGYGLQVDQTGGRYCIVYRNTPFSPASWNQLIMTSIGSQITQMSRNRTTQDVVNITQILDAFYSQSLGTNTAAVQVFSPLVYDENSITQYGVQMPLQTQVGALTQFTNSNSNPFTINNPQNLFNFTLQLSLLAWSWYHQNPNFWQGTLVTAGNPVIRVGERIYLTEDGMEAYVEQIQESASILRGNVQPYQMQITFSRGMTPNVKAAVQEDWNNAMAQLGIDTQAIDTGAVATASTGGS